ncbi:MAG: hypothetical protein HZA83_03160 [Thaumarchaeota archaeon]|nr:hypothetical protein [Nitrososphaerota archaeon]
MEDGLMTGGSVRYQAGEPTATSKITRINTWEDFQQAIIQLGSVNGYMPPIYYDPKKNDQHKTLQLILTFLGNNGLLGKDWRSSAVPPYAEQIKRLHAFLESQGFSPSYTEAPRRPGASPEPRPEFFNSSSVSGLAWFANQISQIDQNFAQRMLKAGYSVGQITTAYATYSGITSGLQKGKFLSYLADTYPKQNRLDAAALKQQNITDIIARYQTLTSPVKPAAEPVKGGLSKKDQDLFAKAVLADVAREEKRLQTEAARERSKATSALAAASTAITKLPSDNGARKTLTKDLGEPRGSLTTADKLVKERKYKDALTSYSLIVTEANLALQSANAERQRLADAKKSGVAPVAVVPVVASGTISKSASEAAASAPTFTKVTDKNSADKALREMEAEIRKKQRQGYDVKGLEQALGFARTEYNAALKQGKKADWTVMQDDYCAVFSALCGDMAKAKTEADRIMTEELTDGKIAVLQQIPDSRGKAFLQDMIARAKQAHSQGRYTDVVLIANPEHIGMLNYVTGLWTRYNKLNAEFERLDKSTAPEDEKRKVNVAEISERSTGLSELVNYAKAKQILRDIEEEFATFGHAMKLWEDYNSLKKRPAPTAADNLNMDRITREWNALDNGHKIKSRAEPKTVELDGAFKPFAIYDQISLAEAWMRAELSAEAVVEERKVKGPGEGWVHFRPSETMIQPGEITITATTNLVNAAGVTPSAEEASKHAITYLWYSYKKTRLVDGSEGYLIVNPSMHGQDYIAYADADGNVYKTRNVTFGTKGALLVLETNDKGELVVYARVQIDREKDKLIFDITKDFGAVRWFIDNCCHPERHSKTVVFRRVSFDISGKSEQRCPIQIYDRPVE